MTVARLYYFLDVLSFAMRNVVVDAKVTHSHIRNLKVFSPALWSGLTLQSTLGLDLWVATVLSSRVENLSRD